MSVTAGAGVPSRARTAPLWMAAGLAALGAGSYGFLALAARGLSQSRFAELGIVWTALFTVGPGLFLPLEQEIGRRLAAAGTGQRSSELVRRALVVGAAITVALTAAAAAGGCWVTTKLLGGDTSLLVAMVAANVALWPVHTSRGVLSGTGRFSRYGAQLAVDGVLRSAGAAALAAAGVTSPAPYAWVLTGSQIAAVAVTVLRRPRPDTAVRTRQDTGTSRSMPGPSWRALTVSVALLMAAALASQVLANGGTIAVRLLSRPGDPQAGHFLTALVVARVPLFLFAAVQAPLLTGLAKVAASGDTAELRSRVWRWLGALTALGSAATGLLAVLGPDLTAVVFGPGYRIDAAVLTLLSLGSVLFVLASTMSQALLAVHAVGAAALSWVVGASTFAAALLLPGSAVVRAGSASAVGAAVVCLTCGVALRRRLRRLARAGEGCE